MGAEERCESLAPICKGDTGPLRCEGLLGHSGFHHARDYEHEVWPHQAWRRWDDRGQIRHVR